MRKYPRHQDRLSFLSRNKVSRWNIEVANVKRRKCQSKVTTKAYRLLDFYAHSEKAM